MKNNYTFILIAFIFSIVFQVQSQTQIGNDIDGETAGDWSGRTVALSSDGKVLAIAAHLNDDNGPDSGHVRVYENISGAWIQIGQDIDGESAGDRLGLLGLSLSSDGSVLAIGAPLNDGNGNDSGHVRVFKNILGVWTQIGQDIDGETAGDRSGFGVSLSADGNLVAIGAYLNDGNGTDSGHVRIYENISGVWTQIGQDIDGEASQDYSGISVSLSSDGSIVAIGANQNDGNGTNSGHVRVYENISGVWTQIGQDINGEAAADYSGEFVSLSSNGNIVAVGADHNDANGTQSGHVRIYENISGVWTQIGQDINGEAAQDRSGHGLSLSSDGSIVAIGAYLNDGNGTDSGHVRIYENISGVWTQTGNDIDGEAANDLFGRSLSLSGDGSFVAIGGALNDGNGTDSGHVRVYELEIADSEPPVITGCPTDIYQGTDDNVCTSVVTWIEPTASDNITESNLITWEKSHEPGDTFSLGTTTVTYTATDLEGNTSLTCSFNVTVTNKLPNTIDGIILSTLDPIQVGTEFSLFADFDDYNLTSATWYLSSDGEISSPLDAELSFQGVIANGGVSGIFNFDSSLTGVYAVMVIVEDACGETAEAKYNYVVVYNPDGGFVTGGGWFNSPEGALVGTNITGKANFGFVAKYQNGNNIVNGNTNFQFKRGDFHFKSSEYDEMSLVISGGKKATFRGYGTVNGSGNHKFMVTVIDGDAQGGDGDDKFRIRVWENNSSSSILYDNEINSAENADSSTILGGGSIVIHKPKNGNNAKTADFNNESSKEERGLFNFVSYPNPSENIFSISVSTDNYLDKVDIQVMDITGKRVHYATFDYDYTYNFGSSLEAGIYFVKVSQGVFSKTLKIIKR